MKTIEVDEDLYRYIASQTQHIGESASDILRRLLGVEGGVALDGTSVDEPVAAPPAASEPVVEPTVDAPIAASLQQLLDGELLSQRESAIERFMLILTALYQSDAEAFTRATEIKGRKRTYFSRSEEELLASGNTTKPKPVPGTPYWVISNTNTGRKRNILAQLMECMGHDAETIARLCDKI
ncbi:replication initiation negative regulator SeqA [Pseudaeromonas sharmana]|uniref:Negative modulator of initiation of replication n=1 Tax=Pseudaeromonas sharmana TaxID=328412 RepID=A0ABV8CRN9_9GAMM